MTFFVKNKRARQTTIAPVTPQVLFSEPELTDAAAGARHRMRAASEKVSKDVDLLWERVRDYETENQAPCEEIRGALNHIAMAARLLNRIQAPKSPLEKLLGGGR